MEPQVESNLHRHKAETPCPGDAGLPANARFHLTRTNETIGGSLLKKTCPFSSFVPIQLEGETLVHSLGSKSLIDNEIGLDDLQRMTDLFYQKAFSDSTLDPFIHSHSDPHGIRLAKWIHQQLTGSFIWDEDCRIRDKTPFQIYSNKKHIVDDLTSAHTAARGCLKRSKGEYGRAFQLDECRVWMRLHFWAMRESGILLKSPGFADYYVRFIGHYIGIYESQSPLFTRESCRWSENPENIERYLASGCQMKDVVGLSMEEATHQLPEEESSDTVWPCHQQIQ